MHITKEEAEAELRSAKAFAKRISDIAGCDEVSPEARAVTIARIIRDNANRLKGE